jgi:hypothetical protein
MSESRRGRYSRQEMARDGRGKAGQMREVRQGSCARQGWADARGNAGQLREASPVICVRQGRAVVWRCISDSPTLSCPVVLFLSPTGRSVVIPDLEVFCLTNRTALTTWISTRTLLPTFGPRKSVLFYLTFKPAESRLVSRELH